MDALWNLEDKWKVTTQEAVIVLACTAFLVVGFCAATALKRRARRRQLVDQEPIGDQELRVGVVPTSDRPRPGCGSVMAALVRSVRWSKASRYGKEEPRRLLLGGMEAEVGWQSHNSASPVWQRPILMGEKCELPRFSGLILYDETGTPLRYSAPKQIAHQVGPDDSKPSPDAYESLLVALLQPKLMMGEAASG
ncbi:uncharacterized protein LOC127811101 [Diospyros lotus]|uniref:uncharacterized protein LOC127811101 n=1 Tax=Diospyros lotus TaxID=55363 RepID=UPI002253B950|nr:uncharacterized protein LOC127811101 [Diospyros lotus]